MEDGNYDKDYTNQATQPTANVLSQPTLAQTYSSLLNNYNNYTSQLSGQGSQPSSTGSTGTGGTLNIPSWLPSGVSMAGALTGNSLYGTLASNAMKIAGGNVEGGIGGLSGLFTGLVSGGKVPSGLVSTGLTGYLQGKDGSTIGKDLANTGIGYGLSMANPMLGLGYGLARMLGLDVMRGLKANFNPNTEVPESWNGGFFTPDYTPDSGSYMSSGNSKYSPYGGSSYNEPSSSNPTGYDSGSAYGSTGYGSTSNDTSGDS
jgi:hypothetical protein